MTMSLILKYEKKRNINFDPNDPYPNKPTLFEKKSLEKSNKIKHFIHPQAHFITSDTRDL